ncbi:MAG TPA: CdaR family protein [Candidatus Limnocylindrales bacterium]|nr:CdaR family protein [Candidatus Limnocylindrales bacterium]
MRRAVAVVLRNWPIKLAAIVVAVLLYTAFVLAGNVRTYPGQVPIEAINTPSDAVLVEEELPSVQNIRYVSPTDVVVTADSFRATVDLANADPTPENPLVTVPVRVSTPDSRIQVISYNPSSIQVRLDPLETVRVPVRIETGAMPPGLSLGATQLSTDTVAVTGASSVVRTVVAGLGRVVIQPNAIDIDQDVPLQAINSIGEVVSPVDIEPDAVHVTIPVLSDAESKTLPVNAVLVGTPASGYQVVGIGVEPVAVSVSGDADALAALDKVDTVPASIAGRTEDVTQVVELDLPDGVTSLGLSTVTIRVTIAPLTETRTYAAGIVLEGAAEDRTYLLSTDRVSVVLGGTAAALGGLDPSSFTVFVDVAGLGPGAHEVPVKATLPADVSLVSASPESVTVTVGVPVSPSPSAAPSPSP